MSVHRLSPHRRWGLLVGLPGSGAVVASVTVSWCVHGADPNFFHDGATGKSYLVWKSDGNAIGKPTPIHLAVVTANGTKVEGGSVLPVQRVRSDCARRYSRRVAHVRAGPWTTLISNTLPWEGPLVEAPWLVVRNSTYYLFYSGNNAPSYAVGVR